METLVAEDLLLLLLDDEKGTLAASSNARSLFGGALLVELALDGLVEVEERTSVWRSAKVRPVDGAPPPGDPLLAAALATVAERRRSAQDLVARLGKGVREQLQERLVERGVLERREGRILGLFPHPSWPAADVGHERVVRQRLHDVLVTGVDPDPRTAALAGLLAAVDQAHRQVDRAAPAGQVKKRAKAVAQGDWAAGAVRDAVQAAQAATMAAVMAASTAATSSGSGS